MKITRRNFVQTFGTAAAITVSAGGLQNVLGNVNAEFGQLAVSKTLFSMKPSQVKALVGRVFTATCADGKTAELVLSEVNGVRRGANTSRGYSGECFSVIFNGRGARRLSQGVYKLRSASLDEFTALVVPTGRSTEEYEVIVNRIKQ